MSLVLRVVQTDEEWAAMHDIRRRVLFEARHGDVAYDENHPDDRAEGHYPHILMLDDEPIGVVRLDVAGDTGVVRLVAVEPAHQRQGHGRLLDAMIGERARELGVAHLRVNAASDAIGFYEKAGWRHETWDANELTGMASDCVQMVKLV